MQDVTKEISASTPRLYAGTMHRIYYTHKGFLRWVVEAFFLAFITTFVPAAVLGSDLAPGDGDHGLDALGFTGMFILTLGVNGRLFLEVHNATYLEAVSYFLMIFFLFFLAYVFSTVQCVAAVTYTSCIRVTWVASVTRATSVPSTSPTSSALSNASMLVHSIVGLLAALLSRAWRRPPPNHLSHCMPPTAAPSPLSCHIR